MPQQASAFAPVAFGQSRVPASAFGQSQAFGAPNTTSVFGAFGGGTPTAGSGGTICGSCGLAPSTSSAGNTISPFKASGSILGGGTPGAPGSDEQRPASTFGGKPAFVKPAAGPSPELTISPTPDPSNQGRMEEFVKRFLLGEELVNTRFHIFSARSSSSGQVTKPRVLCANNLLLANSSKYFLDLFSSDIGPSDPSLTELADDDEVPSDVRIGDYGYESDSDLDDCDDPILETSNVQSVTSPSKPATECLPKDDDDSESVGSDVFVVNSEQSKMDEHLHVNKDRARAAMDCRTAVQEPLDSKTSVKGTETRLRSSGSRHVLVKDAAFQTWYTLLNYLATGKVNFLPLSSATPSKEPRGSGSSYSPGDPKCSAKSMYRLACKVGLNDLRDLALAHIRSNLEDHNILDEILCSLVMSHPQLLDMELDVLFSYIATPPVMANFPALLRRIANKELPHGAEILVIMHSRFLRTLHPSAPLLASTPSSSIVTGLLREPTTTGQEPRDTIENDTASCAKQETNMQTGSGLYSESASESGSINQSGQTGCPGIPFSFGKKKKKK